MTNRKRANGNRRRRRANQRERGGATFICPTCGSLSRVMRTARPTDSAVLRQRRCMKCDLLFNTVEVQDLHAERE
jgi:transcription elongation factor Elf1